MIKILNNSFNRLGIIKNTISCRRSEELNSGNTLDFTAVLDNKLNTFIDEDTIFEIDNEYFDIAYFKKESHDDNTYIIDVETEHISYRLNDPLLNVEYFTEQGTPTYILGKILEGTDFTIGTIDFSDVITYSAQEEKSRRGLLMEFVAYLEGEIAFSNFEISILSHRGSTVAKPILKGKNVNVISKLHNKRQKNEEGDAFVSYSCEPVYRPGDSYALGDAVLLIQADLNIREQLRVVSLQYNPYKSGEVELQFANYVNGLTDRLYRIETTTVVKDKIYNGTRIGPEFGFEAVRSDNKARAYFKSDGMAFQGGDGEGNWANMLYYDYDPETHDAILVFDGLLATRSIEAITAHIDEIISNAVIVNNLYAEKGNIVELTVDQMDTSGKVQKYAETDTSDDDYIKIVGKDIELLTASTDGLTTTQATDRHGWPLYWADETHASTTTDVTDFPVTIYEYDELVKLALSFKDMGGVNTPVITLGAGSGVLHNPDYGKGFVWKGVKGLYLDYLHSTTGELRRIMLTDDGIDFSETVQGKVIFTDETVVEGITQVFVAPIEPVNAKPKDIWISENDYSRFDKTALTSATTLDISANEFITCSGTFSVTLHAGSVEGVIKKIYNIGTGLITIMGNVNGVINMLLYPNESVELITDGSHWRC